MTSRTEQLVIECPLYSWSGPGHCYVCDKDLGEPRRRWCGDACKASFSNDHNWNSARMAVLRRDGGCVRCEHKGGIPDDVRAWERFLRIVCGQRFVRVAYRDWHRTLIETEGPSRGGDWKKRDRELRKRCEAETGLPLARWHEFERLMGSIYHDFTLEVNHITPILGRHGEFGCLHHRDGLETLCGRCHKDETRQQRARGEFG